MSADARSRPQVSVVIATYQGEERIVRALRSLAEQTMEPRLFEIVVVINGPTDATPLLVEEFKRDQPAHLVKVVVTDESGASNARNIGVRASIGAYVTFMDDDDYISPRYLEALLAAAAPGVVPVAHMMDVPDIPVATYPALEPASANYFTAQILPHAGELVPAEKAASALSTNVCKLIPTAVARRMLYRLDLRSGEDFVYWTEVFARTQFSFRILDVADQAIYYRTIRPGSVSRQALSYDFNVTQRLNCIRALNSMDQNNAVVRQVVRGKIDAQAQFINAYLLAHRTERQHVLADIRAFNLPWFPYSSLNRGTARDLAFLYCFLPYRDTSALVAARRIRERGVPLDVVANRLDKVRSADPWSLEVCHEFLDQMIVTETPQAMGSWRCIRIFTEEALSRVEQLIAQKGPYESVYSRSMWPASHFAAAAFKLKHPESSWIAEFSDPMLYDIHGVPRPDLIDDDELFAALREAVLARGFAAPDGRRMWEWVELIAYALADQVVFTNSNQREYMLSYVEDSSLADRAAGISTVEHHPTLPWRFYEMEPADYELDHARVNLAYFGAFYETRALSEVLAALAGLDSRQRRRVQLHIFTGAVDDTTEKIRDAGLADVVKVNAYLPFLAFLNATTRFDVLLVNDADTSSHHRINPYLPSKLSDYLGSGSSIWSLVEDGSVLSGIPAAYTSRLGDVAGARGVLLEILGEPRISGQLLDALASPR
jgi:glycosyltransferase involved in cell wall biosynthesis